MKFITLLWTVIWGGNIWPMPTACLVNPEYDVVTTVLQTATQLLACLQAMQYMMDGSNTTCCTAATQDRVCNECLEKTKPYRFTRLAGAGQY